MTRVISFIFALTLLWAPDAIADNYLLTHFDVTGTSHTIIMPEIDGPDYRERRTDGRERHKEGHKDYPVDKFESGDCGDGNTTSTVDKSYYYAWECIGGTEHLFLAYVKITKWFSNEGALCRVEVRTKIDLFQTGHDCEVVDKAETKSNTGLETNS